MFKGHLHSAVTQEIVFLNNVCVYGRFQRVSVTHIEVYWKPEQTVWV